MRRILILIAMAVAALAMVAGCSDDPVTGGDPVDDSGLVRADVDATLGDFELTVASGGDPNRPFPGPFVIRGRNIHYDETTGALVADLSVVNRSRTAHPEPVGLTFMALLPEGVEVLNPDNDIHGPGAAIVFGFANDDAMWTPGEESLPRPVHFKTERGRAVAFVARIDIARDPTNGAIGGIVWNDANANGLLDIDEPGIGGAEITLARGGFEDSSVADILYRTHTDRTGLYRFAHLPAGFYTVTRTTTNGCRPTTPTQIHVILVDTDDGTSQFLSANFGCQVPEPPPPPDSLFIKIGDWIEATGKYDGRPMGPFAPALFAHTLRVDRCGCPPPCLGGPCPALPIMFNGPVTAINLERRAIQVMGTWLLSPQRTDLRAWIPLEDIKVGDRVSAGVFTVDDGTTPIIASLDWWEKDMDIVSGYVDGVLWRSETDGPPIAAFVFTTRVELTQLAVDPF